MSGECPKKFKNNKTPTLSSNLKLTVSLNKRKCEIKTTSSTFSYFIMTLHFREMKYTGCATEHVYYIRKAIHMKLIMSKCVSLRIIHYGKRVLRS